MKYTTKMLEAWVQKHSPFFYCTVNQNNYDIISLKETWLHPEVELFDSRYKVFRRERDLLNRGLKRGGGVMIAVKSKFDSRLVSADSIVESIMVEVSFNSALKIVFGVGYFRPGKQEATHKSYFGKVEQMATDNDNQFMIFGDFNCPKYDNNIYSSTEIGCDRIASIINDFLCVANSKQINSVLNCNNRKLYLILASTKLIKFIGSRIYHAHD